jgi:predicted enzyme related to lactoylglutathione lyase
MFKDSKAFSGIAVDDIDAARRFYGETLGLGIEVLDEENGLIALQHGGEVDTLIYAKPDLQPANYTVLNFPVGDVEAAVDSLAERGVEFERYDGFDQDEKGITRGNGPEIAWFKDPAGNILSVVEQQ